ncbi:ABC transporter ATP-binding protein [Rubrivirga sp.]|uniref:ABC transporter ATP-binding protein n=1 Tax=Rubrivirga sp. TaxID=1885344 RepID=UPI003C72B00C
MPGVSLSVTNLVKRYGDETALDVPALEVAPGERIALVGNNGAGKTTLLRSVLDLIEPTAGTVTIDGLEVGGSGLGWKHRVGSYLDAGFLVDFLRPEEYFRLVGGAYGMSALEVDAQVERYRSFLGAALEGRRLIRDLSLGNAGKVGILGALLPSPGLVLLDEPFANLDPGARIALERLLLEVDATVLVSSHDLDHVVGVCSRVLVLSEGRVVRDTPSRPDTVAELRDFFAAGGLVAA